jgi:transposase
MGKITRKSYTREFKLSLIRELESGKKLGQISRENNIHPNMISRWKLEYEKNPESAFSGNGNTYKDEARKDELERLVGKLYAETEFLKKALSALEKKAQEDRVKLKAERNS